MHLTHDPVSYPADVSKQNISTNNKVLLKNIKRLTETVDIKYLKNILLKIV
jgi:hypothetical protein